MCAALLITLTAAPACNPLWSAACICHLRSMAPTPTRALVAARPTTLTTRRRRCRILRRPYARVDRKKLKAKLLANCVASGVQFHIGKAKECHHGLRSSTLECRDGAQITASVVVDATGHARLLTKMDGAHDPGYQAAYGIKAGAAAARARDARSACSAVRAVRGVLAARAPTWLSRRAPRDCSTQHAHARLCTAERGQLARSIVHLRSRALCLAGCACTLCACCACFA